MYRWSAIAARLPGRTDNEIKNYWNTHIRKRLLRMGIDPVTHSPRLDLLDLSSILNYSSSIHHHHHHPSSNLSRLFGVQPLVNPELLRLATSLLSSHKKNNFINQQDFQPSLQNQSQENIFYNNNNNNPNLQVQNHHNLPPLVQHSQLPTAAAASPSTTQTCVPNFSSSEAQLMQPNNNINVFPNFSSQINSSCDDDEFIRQWQNDGEVLPPPPPPPCSTLSEQDYYQHQLALQQNFAQSILDGSESTTNNNNFGTAFHSLLSTPSSSPTPLNSNNSTNYINNSSSCTTTEDEREISYCSNMLKFEIPDILDVSDFM